MLLPQPSLPSRTMNRPGVCMGAVYRLTIAGTILRFGVPWHGRPARVSDEVVRNMSLTKISSTSASPTRAGRPCHAARATGALFLTPPHGNLRFHCMEAAVSDVRREFERVFGAEGRVSIIRAPGRVNLIGEHTDYNDGFVSRWPSSRRSALPAGAQDGLVRLASTFFPNQIAEFSIEKKIERGDPAWANYSRGVAAEFLAAGIPLVGMDAMFMNTLPVGGGLSSSAAIEVGTARALLALVAKWTSTAWRCCARRPSTNYANVPCGIMDQTIVAVGAGGACDAAGLPRSGRTFVPIDGNELRVVIVNSMVRHELSGSEYSERRKQCEAGVAHLAKADPKNRRSAT